MTNLLNVWSTLGARRRLVVIGAAIAVFAAVLGLTRGAGVRDMALLYAGLDPGAAGGVITALDQRGVVYEVRGDAIWVTAADRDLLRLSLAGEGLPTSSSQGYELLDSLSGFGTTSQMFDAAYWRAKEGELARTILSVPGVRTARVHISAAPDRPFARDARATAAVTVSTGSSGLSADQARALRHLVASAVSGLRPENVAVIDAETGLIPADDPVGAGDSRAEEMRHRATRLIEARVGPGNAVVEVAVETVTESESVIERRIDPDSRIAISTEVQENARSAQNAAAGAVTVASNLPDGEAGGQGGGSQSTDSESRTLTNFDLSETSREVVRGPGAVRRLTVAVLVNDLTTTAADGTVTTTPRSEEEMTALRDLVASAVGFDADRGDEITIRSLAFEPMAADGTEGVAAGMSFDVMGLVRLAVLAAVALILGLFVLRPILTSRRAAAAADSPALLPAVPVGLPAPLSDTARVMPEAEIIDPVTRLRRLIEERQDETIQILQTWIEEPARRERA